MQDMTEIRKEQDIERTNEHNARLKRQRKRKQVLVICGLAILCLTPLFLAIGRNIEYRTKRAMKERELTPDIDNFPTGGVEVPSREEREDKYNDELKKEKSDIKGMSKYDKTQEGLNPYDGSDTDRDGLTDQEEIEIYGSDPLKCSTAGDLYSDGYKVAHNLELNEKYDYEGDPTCSDEEGFVTLYAKTPFDVGNAKPSSKDPVGTPSWSSTGMSVRDYTEEAKRADEEQEAFHIHYCLADKFYKAFMIHSYDGEKIEIDLGSIAKSIDKDVDELDIEAYAKQPDCKLSLKSKGKKRIVSIKRDKYTEGSPFNAYIVYVVEKDSAQKASLNSSANSLANIIGSKIDEYDENHGLILICTPATVFLHTPPKIYCSEDATDSEKAALIEQGTKVYQSVFYEPIWVQRPVCDESNLTYTSSSTIKTINNICDLVLGKKNNISTTGSADVKGRYTILMYENMGDFYEQSKIDKENKSRERAERYSAFSLSDEFNFANFDSIYSNSGVCLGFARVAAEVYNDDCVQQPFGKMTDKDHFTDYAENKTIDYNITQLDDCETFFDRFINDYDTSLNPLKENENEVIKMLTYYWAEGNTKMYDKDNDWQSYFIDAQKGHYVSWETVERAVEQIRNHKALICGLSIGNCASGAHAINLVGYKQYGSSTITKDGFDLDIEDCVIFDTYDSNNPQTIGSLYCYKCRLADGNCIVLYEYSPVAGYETPDDYRSQFLCLESDNITPDEDQMIMFCILDETMKSLTVRQWYK